MAILIQVFEVSETVLISNAISTVACFFGVQTKGGWVRRLPTIIPLKVEYRQTIEEMALF